MKINPSIFKAYDIRGIYPTDLNEENIIPIIKAIYTVFVESIGKEKLSVVLGRDMRLSSPVLFKKAKETLLNLGGEVIDIGLSSTPTFYFAVLNFKYDAGIQISASHNPKEYNGIKFVKRVDRHLIKFGAGTGMNKVAELVMNNTYISKNKQGVVKKHEDIVKDEVDFAFNLIKPKNIKKLKVVADPANAMASLYLREIFSKLPCELIEMNFELDGRFPAHPADPFKIENLESLRNKVKEEKADLGIAPDGDGDRVFFIDQKGEVVPTSLIASLISGEILKKHYHGKVIVDVRYTRNISRTIKKNNGVPIIGKVGHALITALMAKEKALFSGESSGHYYYQDTGYAESGVLTILYVLELIGKENKPISEIVKRYQSSFESGEVNFVLKSEIKAENVFKKIEDDYQDGQIVHIDGLSVDYPHWRLSLRSSNTEPLIRLNIEADTLEMVNKKLLELKNKIVNIGAEIKE